MSATEPSTQSPTQAIIDRHDAYLSLNYPRFDVAMVRGQGSELWDAQGQRYVDLFVGFGAPVLGHCHPDLVEAVTQQANTLWHVGNLLHTEPQTHAAEAIAKLGFGGRSFFSHAGADANEAAIKLCRLYGKANPGPNGQRYKVISATKSFHGRSFATMGATGNPAVREGFGPLLPGFVNVAYNDLDAVAAEADDDAVAVIVEPIQGEGGINLPDAEYFQKLRAFCDEKDLLLICDEVWTGCGRTGRVFGHQLWGITPDIMTLGKGVGGGLPVGVMCAKPELAELYNARTQGGVKHASTLGGNCLAMAVTARIFEVIQRDGLCERAERLGQALQQRLQAFGQATGLITQVRGAGLFLGIQVNVESEDAWFNSAGEVVGKALSQGLLIGSAQADVLRLAPALTVDEAVLDEGLSTLEQVLRG